MSITPGCTIHSQSRSGFAPAHHAVFLILLFYSGNGERQCIAKCMDRFQDGLKVVNQTIMQRSKAEAESMHHSAGLQ